MRKLSTSLTFINKHVFPVLWFGILGLVEIVAVVGILIQNAPIASAIVPLAMMLFGYEIMKWLIFDLMDEVYLDGGTMIVRNSGDEDRFPVTNILNVSSTLMTNPERITLTLREPCRFGREITFSPLATWWPFRRNPIAAELIELAHGLEER
jgi:hypothetical protein